MKTGGTLFSCDHDSAEILLPGRRMMNGQRTYRRIVMQDGKSR